MYQFIRNIDGFCRGKGKCNYEQQSASGVDTLKAKTLKLEVQSSVKPDNTSAFVKSNNPDTASK